MPASKLKVVDVLNGPISDEDLLSLYRWLDVIFTRPKKTAPHRDFADGVLMAELVAHYIPKIINTRHYFAASGTSMKIANWDHLNTKVFSKIRFQLTPKLISAVANARPGMIELVLRTLRPILLKGPDAISPPATKLENIRPRFMDIGPKYKPNVTMDDNDSEISGFSSLRSMTATPAATPRQISNSSRSRSAGHGAHSRKNSTSSGQDRGCCVTCSRKPRSKTSAPESCILSKQSVTHDASNSNEYEPEGGSSPTRTSDKGKYMARVTPTFTKGENIKKNPSSRTQPVYTSSWLPREVEPVQNTEQVDETEKQLENNEEDVLEIIHKIDKKHDSHLDDEEEVDEEIYSHGYFESSADNKGILSTSCETKSCKPNPPKRKVKRVIKYEFREEYVLNVSLPFQNTKDK